MGAKITDKNIEALTDEARVDSDFGIATPSTILAIKEDPSTSPGVKQELPSLALLRDHQKVVKSAQLIPTYIFVFVHNSITNKNMLSVMQSSRADESKSS